MDAIPLDDTVVYGQQSAVAVRAVGSSWTFLPPAEEGPGTATGTAVMGLRGGPIQVQHRRVQSEVRSVSSQSFGYGLLPFCCPALYSISVSLFVGCDCFELSLPLARLRFRQASEASAKRSLPGGAVCHCHCMLPAARWCISNDYPILYLSEKSSFLPACPSACRSPCPVAKRASTQCTVYDFRTMYD